MQVSAVGLRIQWSSWQLDYRRFFFVGSLVAVIDFVRNRLFATERSAGPAIITGRLGSADSLWRNFNAPMRRRH